MIVISLEYIVEYSIRLNINFDPSKGNFCDFLFTSDPDYKNVILIYFHASIVLIIYYKTL